LIAVALGSSKPFALPLTLSASEMAFANIIRNVRGTTFVESARKMVLSLSGTDSKRKHNFSEILPFGDVTMSRRHLCKLKHAVDQDSNLARLNPPENLVQLRDRARLFHEKCRDRKAGRFPTLRKSRRQVASASAQAAQRDESAARGQNAKALLERLAGDCF
jgi:hypothetical protein